MNLYLLSLKKYLAYNRRTNILALGGMCAAMIFIGFFYAEEQVQAGMSSITLLTYIAIMACVRASLSFSSMKTHRGRISTLMTPSSIRHKFMARWTVEIPLMALFLLAIFWLSEATRVLTWPLLNDGTHTDWFSLNASDITPSGCLFLITGILSVQSFFFFGAIAWPRLSALKTILVMWTISTVATIIFFSTHFFKDWLFFLGNNFDSDTIGNIATIANIVTSLFFWSLAYLRFRESDVTDHLI